MKITLRDTKPYPIWLNPTGFRPFAPGCHYYRIDLPLKVTGGREIHSLRVLNRARQLQTFNPFIKEELRQFAALPEATVLGLGSPTVIRMSVIMRSTRLLWVPIITALCSAGADICLEMDDDIFGLFSDALNQPFIRIEIEKYRAAIIQQLQTAFPWKTQTDLDSWWESYIPVSVERKIDEVFNKPVSHMVAAARILCSTEPLSDSIRKMFGSGTRISVAPNFVDPADFVTVPREGDTVRIGYAGTPTHGKDLPLAMPGFAECAKLPNVELVFFGQHPRSSEGDFTPGVYEWNGTPYTYAGPSSDFSEFVKRISALDIAVAPLADNVFNRCKSPQKWFESSMHGTAMVLSDLPVYDCVTHGVTGFKAKTADEFTYYMRLLVENAELRRKMGAAAREAVLTRHTTAQWADHWKRAVGAGREVEQYAR
jgi:glycosyltransferase involved in cell wall biosynthesis